MLASRAAGQPLTGPIELSLPSLTWVVTVPASGFVLEANQSARDGTSQRLMAKNPETNVIVSGVLELTRPGATSAQCREFYWTEFSRRLELPRESTRTFERGEFAMVEYVVPEYQGTPINQRNLWIYFGKDGACGYLHVSKVRFTAADERHFSAIVEGTRISARR